MNIKISSVTAYTFLTIASVLHNTEETLTMKGYAVDSPFAFIQPPTYRQFLVAVSILTLVVIFAFILAIRTKNPKTYLFISTAIASALLLNVLVPHLLVALYTFRYTPGLVSAVLLIFPLSTVVLVKNKRMYASLKQMLSYIVTGLAAGYVLFAAVIFLARLVK